MRDLRLAVRSLLATPVVTVVAVLSLALGIGANTAIFSIVDSLILRALPIPGAERLVTISDTTAVEKNWRPTWNYQVWDQIRRRADLFDGAFAFGFDRFNINNGGIAQFVDGLWVNSAFFSTSGVMPAIGRAFVARDDAQGVGPEGLVTVISYRFWQHHFRGAPDAIGRTLPLDGQPFTVIGIAPEWFSGPEVDRTFDVAVPLSAGPLLRGRQMEFNSRGAASLTVMARLKPGVTREATVAGLRAVQADIWSATLSPNARPEYRQTYLARSFALVSGTHGDSKARRSYGRPLVILMGIVVVLLVIACANVANLMLARGAARQRELSVRLALGASRADLVWQSLAESIVLTVISTVAGAVLASWGSRLLVRQLVTPSNAVSLDLSVDGRVLLFTSGVGMLTVFLAGLLPAVRTSATDRSDALKTHDRSVTDRTHVLAASGVVGQIALALTLVVLAGLLVRTFAALERRPVGFDRDRVLLTTVDARRSVPVSQQLAFSEELRAVVRGVAGVEDGAVSIATPVSGSGFGLHVEIPGAVQIPNNVYGVNAMANVVSPGFFATLGTPLLAGRDFEATDAATSPVVAVVNRALARAALGESSPIGRTITMTLPTKTFTAQIVGVVADAVYMSMRETPQPTVYTPLAQYYMAPALLMPVTVSARAARGSPEALAKGIEAALVARRSDVTLSFISLGEQTRIAVAQERVVAILSGAFSALALLLAALGLYGITAYAVARRRTEIGIRMALGATSAAIIRLIGARLGVLILMGLGIGAALSAWASQFVRTLVFGLEPRDATTLLGSVVVLLMVGLTSGAIPAWRAARVDPADVLRDA
jgi:predicted permease